MSLNERVKNIVVRNPEISFEALMTRVLMDDFYRLNKKNENKFPFTITGYNKAIESRKLPKVSALLRAYFRAKNSLKKPVSDSGILIHNGESNIVALTKEEHDKIESSRGFWVFERSSGCAGYRCVECGTWVYEQVLLA